MIFSNLKTFWLVCALHFFLVSGYAQVPSSNIIEEKAVNYFCDYVLKDVKQISQSKILFNGATNGKPSRIYDVADCLGDINLFKDSIPNKAYLDSLEQKYSQTKSRVIKIAPINECFSKRSIFKKIDYGLYLYNAIEYKGNYYVEFFLANKEFDTYTIIVTLDTNLVPLNYCVKALTYD